MNPVLSHAPHFRSGQTIEKAMTAVLTALLPGLLAGIWFFGLGAIAVTALSVAGCLLFEALALKLRRRDLAPLRDGSAVVTGVLLAMNLPSNLPLWMVAVGAAVAILFGKHVYGGLGYNPFNPALVARVFLLISFPVAMTSWPVPGSFPLSLDAVTAATPLGKVKEAIIMTGMGGEAARIDLTGPFLGNVGGSLGEVSALALTLGGLFLLARKVITWHIPAGYLGAVFLLGGAFHLLDPARYPGPLFHLVTGGVVLGAFFMATDWVTSPVTGKGMLIFGTGCGFLTMLIRLFGGYPEGVSFAILLMNAFTPIIDRFTVPRTFGHPAGRRKEAAA